MVDVLRCPFFIWKGRFSWSLFDFGLISLKWARSLIRWQKISASLSNCVLLYFFGVGSQQRFRCLLDKGKYIYHFCVVCGLASRCGGHLRIFWMVSDDAVGLRLFQNLYLVFQIFDFFVPWTWFLSCFGSASRWLFSTVLRSFVRI